MAWESSGNGNGIYFQDTPSTTWIINHETNSYPVTDVTVVYESAREKILPLMVEYTSPNQITVTFSQPVTGNVRLVGAIKFSFTPGANFDTSHQGGTQ